METKSEVIDYSEALVEARGYLHNTELAAAMHEYSKALAYLVAAQRELATMNLSLVALDNAQRAGR